MKIGSWVDVNNVDRDSLVKSGAVISPTAMLDPSLRICFPVHISPRVQIKNGVSIDKFSFINWESIIYPNVYIGQYCSIGRNVQIGLANHPTDWLSTHTFQYNEGWFPNLPSYKKVKRTKKHLHHPKTKIGADVWIGNNAMIKSGVSIGHGAVIGAGALVTKDVPPYAIVVGVPAKIIKFRFSDDIISQLLELKWWQYNVDKVANIDFSDINKALSQLKALNKN